MKSCFIRFNHIHPCLYFNTMKGTCEQIPFHFFLKFMMLCYAGRTGSEGYRYHFPEAEDFQTFLDTVSSYRDYDTGTELSATDRIVTLSTCVNSRRNYRYLVHGKLSSEIITEE